MNSNQDTISSDNDALRWGILLSVQQEKFGINMLDSLSPADEPELRSLMEDRSLSRNDAALIIFERRFGVAPSESNNNSKVRNGNSSLTPKSNGRTTDNGNALSSSSMGEGSRKKKKKKGKVEYTPEGRPMVTSPVQFTPFSSPGGVVQRRSNSSDEDDEEPLENIINHDQYSVRAPLHQSEMIPPQVSQRVSPRNPYNPSNSAFDDNASHNSSNRYSADSGSRPGSGRYSTRVIRHHNHTRREIDTNSSPHYDDRYGYIPSPGSRGFPHQSPPRHNLNDDSSVVSGGGSVSSMRSMNSQFSRSAPTLRNGQDEYSNDRYYRDRSHFNGHSARHEPPIGVRGGNLYPLPGNVPDQYPVRRGVFRQPSRQVTHSFMEPRTEEYNQYYEENPAIAAEIAAQRYFAGINNRTGHSHPPPSPSSYYNAGPPLSPTRHARYPQMQAIPEGRPNMRRHGSMHRPIDPNNFMPSPTRDHPPENGDSRFFADSSSMSGRYSEPGEFRGFGSESFGSASYSGRYGTSNNVSSRHFRDNHGIDRVPSQRAVAIPVPDNDDSRPNAEATFGRNVRNEDVHTLEGMGFTINKILPALQMYDNNVEAAANYLLENQ